MTAAETKVHPTRVAVFGAFETQRAVPPPGDERLLSPAARAVLEQVLESIASSAPSIVQPILDRAVGEGTITRTERHALLRELSDPGAPAHNSDSSPVSLGARNVLREALAAVRRAAPSIAEPILDEAVDAERLTAAQQRRILERLRISPGRVLRGVAGVQVAGGVS